MYCSNLKEKAFFESRQNRYWWLDIKSNNPTTCHLQPKSRDFSDAVGKKSHLQAWKKRSHWNGRYEWYELLVSLVTVIPLKLFFLFLLLGIFILMLRSIHSTENTLTRISKKIKHTNASITKRNWNCMATDFLNEMLSVICEHFYSITWAWLKSCWHNDIIKIILPCLNEMYVISWLA